MDDAMTTGAIALMVLTMGTVTAFTICLFVKILKAPFPTDRPGDGGTTDSPGNQ